MAPCPHCRATAAAEPSATMRWRCAVCGGPLVPSDASFPRSGAELGSLVGAARASAMAFGWTAAAITLGIVASFALVVALVLGHAAPMGAMVLGIVGGVAATLALAGGLRARNHRGEARNRVEQAWASVAGELLAARGGALTAADVARALSIDEPYAERLLSELSAEGRVRVAVRDDAQLSYRPSSPDFQEEASGDTEGQTGAARGAGPRDP